MKLYEATFILPVCLAHDAAAFERKLAERFGGYSVHESRGGWINGKGDLVTDVNRTYTVAIALASIGVLAELLHMAKAEAVRLEQEALYFAYRGRADIIELKGFKS